MSKISIMLRNHSYQGAKQMRKKKALINALVCTAKIATISIPNAFFQVLLQESFDLGKDVLLEFPDEMPHIDDFSTSPAMTNIVHCNVILSLFSPFFAIISLLLNSRIHIIANNL